MDVDLAEIATELDAVHATARITFAARDINGYRALFTEDLRYVPPNGKPIGLGQLMGDVAKQFSNFPTVTSDHKRESLTLNADGTVTQVLYQKATYSISVFFFFRKEWHLERRGIYTFRRTENHWRIADVEVLSETVL